MKKIKENAQIIDGMDAFHNVKASNTLDYILYIVFMLVIVIAILDILI